MTGETIFRRRTAIGLVVTSVATLTITLFYLVFADVPNETRSIGADTFSVSALGYHALVELLKQDVPVVVSRQDSVHKAEPGTPLLVLEPSGDSDQIDRLQGLLRLARKREIQTVVVLPKWAGSPMPRRSDWVGRVRLLPVIEPAAVLATALGDDQPGEDQPSDDDQPSGETIVRRSPDGGPRSPVRRSAWHGELAELGITADIPWAPQLMTPDPEMVVVLGTHHGALVTRSEDALLWLVSDPDFLNTAGVARGDNPLLARALLIGLLEPESLVIDEVLHDYGQKHNLWRALIRFPLICVTLHLLALLAFALWATTSRFGRPLPAPSRLPPGKLTLLDNTARLLSVGGDVKHSLRRYLELTVRQAARRWHIPRQDSRQQVEHLAALARSRGVSEDLEQLATRIMRWPSKDTEPRSWRRAGGPQVELELARGLHRWQKEMLDGPG